jgi:glyoxylase-like metal-dependent hydrolase (beta-lactamase superfamily II)
MFELIQVTEKVFYIQSPAKIGLVLTGENEVCLIDSGNDKDAGKKIRKILNARGWTLKAIYNTHSHADHIGGNRFLQAQTGCRIYAPAIECDFTRHPVLEPIGLYGGNPPVELRHKFLMAQESEVNPMTREVLPEGWEMIPLPGHSFDMAGFRVPGDIVFLADCLSSRATLDKYQIGYLHDVEAYLDTLEKVCFMKAALFIPSHADPTEDIAPLARMNMEKLGSTLDKILEICREPGTSDHILKELFDAYGLVINFEQYALIGSTLRSCLTYLKGKGLLEAVFDRNMLLWKRV